MYIVQCFAGPGGIRKQQQQQQQQRTKEQLLPLFLFLFSLSVTAKNLLIKIKKTTLFWALAFLKVLHIFLY